MPQTKANGLTLEFEVWGKGEDPALLLIMGLGAQMIRWSPTFVEKLVARGLRVIRFDNRDVGLSEKCEAAGPPDMPAIIAALGAGKPAPSAYDLNDMAKDAVGLLDALDVARAHIVGVSMGGMIAQLVAADYSDRTLSLTSIMSTSGHPSLPRATPAAMAVLNERGPDPRKDLEGYLDHMVRGARVIGSPGYPVGDAELRAQARSYFERCYYPLGFMRQYAAVVASPERRPKLATISAPTVVIHGQDDPLVPVSGGRDTAAHIAGADLRVIPGMGHDIPAALHDTIVEGIVSAVSRADAAKKAA